MTFDVNAFLNSTTQAQDRKLVPEGVYQCVVEDVKGSSGTSEKSGKPWVRLDLVLSLDDEGVRQATGRAVNKLTFGVMLDLNEAGDVVITKGSRVYNTVKALGVDADNFNPQSLKGRYGKAQVVHELYKEALKEQVSAVTGV